jgi:hypothetical protein
MAEHQQALAEQEVERLRGLQVHELLMEEIMASPLVASMLLQQGDVHPHKAPPDPERQLGAAYQHPHQANHTTLQPQALVCMRTSQLHMVLPLQQRARRRRDLLKMLRRREAGRVVPRLLLRRGELIRSH